MPKLPVQLHYFKCPSCTCVCVRLVNQSCLTLQDPVDGSPPGSSVHGILQVRVPEWVAFPSPEDLPNPGIEPRSPALQADSLPAEPQGTPKNTGVGSLSLLQQIFPTQELNWGLLHCRWILYHLSHQGSPSIENRPVAAKGRRLGGRQWIQNLDLVDVIICTMDK